MTTRTESLERVLAETQQTTSTQVQEALEAVKEVVAPRVEILSPVEAEQVDWKQTVRGTVRPSGVDNVQVFVLSRDKKWHRKRATVEGGTWRLDDCAFGLADVPFGTPYTVAAILGADTKGDEAVKELPPGIAESPHVKVNRR